MHDINLFLAHAIQLERDAARRFEYLSHAMEAAQSREVERLFRKLGEFSRQHVKTALARSGFRDVPELGPGEFQWPEGVTPEAAGWQGVDDTLDTVGALELALAGETSGHDYYTAIAEATGDPEVRRMALSFAEEEAQHVSELRRWLLHYTQDGSTRE
jgi:rubrerythrin